MSHLPTLWSTRLVLRPFDLPDAPEVERLAGVWEVADATLTIPHPYPAGGAAEWIATHRDAWAHRETLTLAICARTAPDTLLGAISLRISEAHRHGEVGYWIGVSSWGRGYATEAARGSSDSAAGPPTTAAQHSFRRLRSANAWRLRYFHDADVPPASHTFIVPSGTPAWRYRASQPSLSTRRG